MKKIIRITISAVLLAVLCLSLTACRELDQAKSNHGIYVDETKEEIRLRGKTYIRFAETPMENFQENAYPITDEWGIRITDADVPVLLAEIYGESIRYNTGAEEDPIILAITDSKPSSYKYTYYCREDKLDAVRAQMGSASLDHLYMERNYWSTKDDAFVYGKKLLSKEMYDVIIKTLERPYDSDKDLALTADVFFSNWRSLYYTDADLLFKNDYEIELVESETGAYYVKRNYYEGDSFVDGDIYWKRIPKADMSVIEPLFSSVIEDEPELVF